VLNLSNKNNKKHKENNQIEFKAIAERKQKQNITIEEYGTVLTEMAQSWVIGQVGLENQVQVQVQVRTYTCNCLIKIVFKK
jgi:hypothetical protein